MEWEGAQCRWKGRGLLEKEGVPRVRKVHRGQGLLFFWAPRRTTEDKQCAGPWSELFEIQTLDMKRITFHSGHRNVSSFANKTFCLPHPSQAFSPPLLLYRLQGWVRLASCPLPQGQLLKGPPLLPTLPFDTCPHPRALTSGALTMTNNSLSPSLSLTCQPGFIHWQVAMCPVNANKQPVMCSER